MFKKSILNIQSNLFYQLSKATDFEDIVKGRKGTVLVNPENDLIPLVRTTTNYEKPAQKFLKIHYDIIDKIKESFKESIKEKELQFNNAMIEIYDSTYRKMKFHTDQSLDLNDDSYICLFSCYENDSNDLDDLRKLKIKNKITGDHSEILLENNSAVIFSTSENQHHLHKIVLESTRSNNKWLGITFRLSKTFIKFIDEIPYIYPKNIILKIASEDERKTLLMCKGNENFYDGFKYPEINYTVSQSDMMQIK